MNSVPFLLDQKLYELLSSGAFQQFTTVSLCDAYRQQLDAEDFNLEDVRYYVYAEIRRMMKTNWVKRADGARVGEPVYQLLPQPKNLKLELINNGFVTYQSSAKKKEATLQTEEHLEMLHKNLRLDFLYALGESERYKQISDEMPHLRKITEQAYLEAKDRSSRLLGHLQAVKQTLKALSYTQELI